MTGDEILSIKSGANRTTRTGGFQIEVSGFSIRVTKDSTAHARNGMSKLRQVLLNVFSVLILVAFIVNWIQKTQRVSPVLILVFTLVILIPHVQSFFTVNNIYATPDVLQVIRVTNRRVNGTWSFPRQEVGPIRFIELSASQYGSTCGLQFKVGTEEVRVLSGLKAPEAQKIMIELERLGYEAPRDISMPMAAEIELDRRQSVFSWT